MPSSRWQACFLAAIVLLAAFSTAAAASHLCHPVETFLPTIYKQIKPFLGGISRNTLDKGRKYYLAKYRPPSEIGPVPGLPEYEFEAAESLATDDPNFPWSHPFMVRVVALNGTLWLPGGRIPGCSHGFSFLRQRSELLHDLVAVNEVMPLPDLEMFIGSTSFQDIKQPEDDGTIFPFFKATGSDRTYDLVLPLADWKPGGPSGPKLPSKPWHTRQNRIVSRYNMLCPREMPVYIRDYGEGHSCARQAFHNLKDSPLNKEGFVDVGAVSGFNLTDKLPRMKAEEQSEAKYALNLPGATVAFRLRNLLEGGQAVIQEEESPLYNWYSLALKPWVHYIPWSRPYESMYDLARFLMANDEIGESIAANGQRFAKRLCQETSYEYEHRLLKEYARLLKDPPRALGPKAMRLDKALELLVQDTEFMFQYLKEQQRIERENAKRIEQENENAQRIEQENAQASSSI